MRSFLLVPFVTLLATAPAYAQIYKWVDESGRTHYSDKAPEHGRKVDTVGDRVSVYSPPASLSRTVPEPSTAALSDRLDDLERQLRAERVARRQMELAAFVEPQVPQTAYVPYPVTVAVPVGPRRRHDGFRPDRERRAPNVAGPGIMPGTFNGPDAVIAGNVTLRTGVPAFRGRGAAAF